MAEYDNKAFNAMKSATKGAPDRMFKDDKVFTESVYNTETTPKEKRDWDYKAYQVLGEIFKADKKRNPRLKEWGFIQYIENLNNKYLEDIIMSKDHPIHEGRDEMRPSYEHLLQNIYEGDVDQLKLSARNVMQERPSRDRSNIPAGEEY